MMDANAPASNQGSQTPTPNEEDETSIALMNSRSTYMEETLTRNLIAKQSHNADLFKTQQPIQGDNDGDVMVLVKFPSFSNAQSCMKTVFPMSYVRLTYKQILETGSVQLKEDLESESYQRRARNAAGPLPKGIKYVLNLSPSTEEYEYSVALQRLSITRGIRLWHRFVSFGASVAAVSGHDDACACGEKWDEPYPVPDLSESIQKQVLFDTESWPMEQYRDIDEYCPVRHGANVLRLFRSIVEDDLHIDSAPRLWTLVGLLGMFGMTKYDLLRDHVVAWFNDGNNYAFVELLPEETMRIGCTINAAMLIEPAFRILVNEHALVVAGGDPQYRKSTTIFKRKSSNCLSGTEDGDRILQKVEHAGVNMADRYKIAIDQLSNGGTLSLLKVPEWEQLLAMGKVIPDDQTVSTSYQTLLTSIRLNFHGVVERIINMPAADQLASLAMQVKSTDLADGKSFVTIYDTLNKAQRALCPFVWYNLKRIIMSDFAGLEHVRRTAIKFSIDLHDAKQKGKLLPGSYPPMFDSFDAQYITELFQHTIDQLNSYVEPLVSRSEMDFGYSMTPHMVLCLDDQEMGYLHYGDETTYEASIPEAELGPSGPGPAYHTGITIPSLSESLSEGFESLALSSDRDGANTVVGSETVQDGNSTVYNRHRVLAQAISIKSEVFTDDGMSAEYAAAELAVPAGHHIGTQDDSGGDDDDIYGVSDEEDELDDDSEDSDH